MAERNKRKSRVPTKHEWPERSKRELADRALAVGLASKPVGWATFPSLLKFRPCNAIDNAGNQIFYRVFNRGYGAEAYSRNPNGAFRRLKISCGSGRTMGVYHFVRLAVATTKGSHRLAIMVSCSGEGAVTWAYSSPGRPPVSLRADVRDRALVEPIANIHDANWLSRDALNASGNRLVRTVSEQFRMSAAPFAPLAALITTQVGGQQKMAQTDELNVGGLLACLAAAAGLLESAKNERPDYKVIIAMIAVLIAYMCRVMAEAGDLPPGYPGWRDPFFPGPEASNETNDDDPDNSGPVAINDDGSVDGNDGDGGVSGGGGRQPGHGPLHIELDKDDSGSDEEDS